MTEAKKEVAFTKRRRRRKFVAVAFICWGTFVFAVLFNQFRTQKIEPKLLQTSNNVEVSNIDDYLQFSPTLSKKSGLLFFCGSGVEAEAYAPLLRPIAEKGYVTVIVKLPGRFAMLPGQKELALSKAEAHIKRNSEVGRWVVGGHSLGAALSCRFIQLYPNLCSGLVLVGTTHPKNDDLSNLAIPVTKIYGTEDGVAPQSKVEANRSLLPLSTNWVLIQGANHSQFANYGHQLQDGKATISPEAQQSLVREKLILMLAGLENS